MYRDLLLICMFLAMVGLCTTCQELSSADPDNQSTETASPINDITGTSAFTEPTGEAVLTSELTSPTTMLTVTSNLPDAEVYINNVNVGQAPYTGQWTVGTYTITVNLPGFQPWQQFIQLTPSESVTLTANLEFTPQIEQLLDVCVEQFWWAKDEQLIFFVECQPKNDFISLGKRFEEGPIWQLDLITKQISQTETAWPPVWVPKQYQNLVPQTIPPWLISVAPSGERVVFFEEISPSPTITATTAITSSDSQYTDPQSSLGTYMINMVMDSNIILKLGTINGSPGEISWTENEQVVFISAHPFIIHEEDGWLIDLASEDEYQIYPLVLPKAGDFHNASILSNGEAILYRASLTAPYTLWYFGNDNFVELNAQIGHREWLKDSRYLIFSNSKGVFWYDLSNDIEITILPHELLPGIAAWQLAPQRNEMLFTQFSLMNGANLDGLWRLVLDTD